jgi:two-component system sensor histidine kinase UhpB
MNYSLRPGATPLANLPHSDTPLADETGTFYRLISETIPHIVWSAAADGRVDFFNRRCYEYTGLRAGELEGWGWKAVVHAEDLQRCIASWTRALQSGERYEIEYRLRRHDGEYRWHHGSAVPLRDARGRPQRWFGTATDIEAEVRSARILESMAEEQARAYAADVRRLFERLVATQESERRRLADELHDLIGQNLTALGIDLAALKQKLHAAGDPVPGARIDTMRSVVEQTIRAIRGVMTDLRPPALEEFGLVPALRFYAAEFSERTGMKAAVALECRERRFAREAEFTLFRIVQEALTNAAKHSEGTMVSVRVSEDAGRVRISVEDDGRGFPDPVGARSARRGGWGLTTMRERAEAHGGQLRVEFPGRGTRIVVEIPAA